MFFVYTNTYYLGDSCQYWMDHEKQEVSSPYYPHNYFGNGVGCEWLITAPEGNIISLEFVHIKVGTKNLSFHLH